MARSMVVILDAGGTRNVRMARALRELGVYSEIWAHDTAGAALRDARGLCGVIVSHGPNRAFDGQELPIADDVFTAGVNVLSVGAADARAAKSVERAPEDDAEETAMLSAFADACGADRSWSMEAFIEENVAALRAQIGNEKVLLALSGGVDSSVVCALLLRAVGEQVTCVHVNHGLLRKGEPEQVVRVFREEMGANLVYVDAQERFLSKLAGVADPERKRKIIGEEFIRVFEEEARKIGAGFFLAQGTIYPDILESGTKTARLVKSHHNTGGLPPELNFTLVEPIKYLFKDEVRALGEALGLPHAMVYRQPFPGPGLGVRCVGAITRERLEVVRESDAILREEFDAAGLAGKVWQYFTVVPDVRSTGVRGGARCFEYPVVLRAVNTRDAMTAEIEEIPYAVLNRITRRMQREVAGCNRVLYDLSPKPVATIEWE